MVRPTEICQIFTVCTVLVAAILNMQIRHSRRRQIFDDWSKYRPNLKLPVALTQCVTSNHKSNGTNGPSIPDHLSVELLFVMI